MVWYTKVIESVEVPPIIGTKQNKKVVKIFVKDEANLWLSKKTKEKQVKKSHSEKTVKIRENNCYKRYV